MMKKQQPSKPKGPWLTNGDLRHDLAIEVACADLLTGQLVNVKFPAARILEDQQAIGGGIVVDPRLTLSLYQAYTNFEFRNQRPPPFISGGDIYPLINFVPKTGTTHTWVGDVMAHRPPKILIFFAVPKKIAIGGRRRGNNKK